MGSKGINFSRSGDSFTTPPPSPRSLLPTNDEGRFPSPSSLRVSARKLESATESLLERYALQIEQTSKQEQKNSQVPSPSSLATEILHALENLEKMIGTMELQSVDTREQSLVKSHKNRLADFRTRYQTIRKKEEETLERLQLIHSAMTPEEKPRDRMDILVDEKISLSAAQHHADEFLEHGAHLRDTLSEQRNFLRSGTSRLRDFARGQIPDVNRTMRAIQRRKTRNLIIMAVFISSLIIIIIIYANYIKSSGR